MAGDVRYVNVLSTNAHFCILKFYAIRVLSSLLGLKFNSPLCEYVNLCRAPVLHTLNDSVYG